jgi:hypothetical protein
MLEIWSCWLPLPDARHCESLQAPIGPGLYEVRDFDSGELIAFDYTPHVASTLSNIAPDKSAALWRRLTHPKWISPRHHDIEYRTCATATKIEAKKLASSLRHLRHAEMCRRAGLSDIGT